MANSTSKFAIQQIWGKQCFSGDPEPWRRLGAENITALGSLAIKSGLPKKKKDRIQSEHAEKMKFLFPLGCLGCIGNTTVVGSVEQKYRNDENGCKFWSFSVHGSILV